MALCISYNELLNSIPSLKIQIIYRIYIQEDTIHTIISL
jgi:hypothetical protein